MRIGGHLTPQISQQSQVHSFCPNLPGSGNGGHFRLKRPLLSLQLLWLENTLKILSSDHKKVRAKLHTRSAFIQPKEENLS